ncbi:MAG: hypothetical protein HY785_25300 [Oscillatoriophycideae cyanobacterium NC_groundwater_1537_Pr4_S-0.65um_50_18]|nr:hypothetical protein [Oscillatoriophycideae cyanobacterium NC_groundwater_1537_Pr4_S-0.65um_50_18]
MVYVQRQPETTRSIEQVRADLTQAIQAHLLAQGFNTMPLVNVIVLEIPASNHDLQLS